MIFKMNSIPSTRYWIIGFLVTLTIGLFLCVGISILFQKENSTVAQEESVVIDNNPSNTVIKFWNLSLEGNISNASDYIDGAPISYLLWEPENLSPDITLEDKTAKKPGNGTGNSNPNYIDKRFIALLKENWTKTIYKNQLKINEVLTEKINDDKAEVILALKRDSSVSSYNIRVLLRKTDNDWKIIAIWDWIN